MKRTLDLEIFEDQINYVFNDKALILCALTHSSALAENPKLASYERLEFLGDAVLELLVSRRLFASYPQHSEGWMTKTRASVVSEKPLADIAKTINCSEFLLLGKGTEKIGGRKLNSILSDVLEALIGAIFVDGGLEAAESFIMPYIQEKIDESVDQVESLDYKTRLQEILQHSGSVKIKYILTSEDGPAHDKIFTSHIQANGKILGSGSGKSKKISHQEAAKSAIEAMKK